MKSKLRIVGLVACLLTIWMVARGVNGCAPTPDGDVPLEIEGTATLPDGTDTYQDGAEVYGSKKLGKIKKETGSNKTKNEDSIRLEWFTLLQGRELTGTLTIINGDKHMHVPYSVDPSMNQTGHTIDIKNKKLK